MLIDQYNICLKILQQKVISEPVFYVDLIYKFKRIAGKPNFSVNFKRYLNIIKSVIQPGNHVTVCMQGCKLHKGVF